MIRREARIIAWVLTLAVAAAWVGVIMFAFQIRAETAEKRQQNSDRELEEIRQSSSARVHAIARDTENLRRELEDLTQVQILEAADSIEQVGKSTDAAITIGSAMPNPQENKNAPKSVSFLIEAEGTFSSIMHTAALLETLPFASRIASMEFQSVSSESSKVSAWRLRARLHLLTDDQS